jgi:hypothetical protein
MLWSLHMFGVIAGHTVPNDLLRASASGTKHCHLYRCVWASLVPPFAVTLSMVLVTQEACRVHTGWRNMCDP